MSRNKTVTACAVCAVPLSAKRSDATTCSAACRQTLHRRRAAEAEAIQAIWTSSDPMAEARERLGRKRVSDLSQDERDLLEMWRDLRAEYGVELTVKRARNLIVNRMERIEREAVNREWASSQRQRKRDTRRHASEATA